MHRLAPLSRLRADRAECPPPTHSFRHAPCATQSAATYCTWKDNQINIIDTPGHVDFTIEVERSLRVLDGAVLVLCGVGGVQSQSITVDRQMRRYDVPRVAFINKLDRTGANPWRVIDQVREKLRTNCAAVQVPMGVEDAHAGMVDIVRRVALRYGGPRGETVEEGPVPAEYAALMEEKRAELVERVAEVDDTLAEAFLERGAAEVTAEELAAGIRRATLALRFFPVFMGSAFKNKGVQTLLDGVVAYLPSPLETKPVALDLSAAEAPVALTPASRAPLVGLAFKLEEGRFGQLTYIRVYQGALRRGGFITNTASGKRVKVPRLVRMHSDDMEDVDSAGPGEIVAMFGVECASGDTFTDGTVNYAMTSMRVPEPVMSLAITPKVRDPAFGKALNRFQKEDPTFRVAVDAESGQTIISGMGELHLEVYVERMRREYKVDAEVGRPRVNYREAITEPAEFDYLHKKQSGGQGQYGRVVGRIEPLPEATGAGADAFEFVNGMVGSAISPSFIQAIEKGFREAVQSGALIGHPVQGVRVTLTDGASHAVDSSELAFKIAALHAFRQACERASPVILEPLMRVEVTVPSEFQGAIVGAVNRRKGLIQSSDAQGDDVVINAEVPLNNMFGYSTELRSMTQGKGEFAMEYMRHSAVTQDVQAELMKAHGKVGRRGI
jgi:elongation factor G